MIDNLNPMKANIFHLCTYCTCFVPVTDSQRYIYNCKVSKMDYPRTRQEQKSLQLDNNHMWAS